MDADIILKQQIENTLESNIDLRGSKIVVTVLNGDVMLTGYANKYFKKDIARKVVKDVHGVRQISEAILIALDGSDKCSDTDISNNIAGIFKRNFGIAHKDIKIVVSKGFVSLEGHLKWKYQKSLAEDCIQRVVGIKNVENNITIPQSSEIAINEKDVLAAIYGDLSITSDIKVEIFGHRVILKGNVESNEQKNLITNLVRNVAGVNEIENFLTVTKIR